MEFELNEWLEYAEKVAASFARTYRSVEKDDLFQELSIELVLKEAQLVEVFRTMEKPDSYTRVILRNRATRYCAAQKNAFFVKTDMYDYQTENVRVMIEQYLGGTKEGMMVPEDAKSISGDDDLAVFGDIARVVDALSDTDQEVLQGYLMDPEQKDTAERQRFNRVVRKVTTALNDSKKKAAMEHDGLGSRKRMSNREALGVIKNSYNTREKDFA
ncbi:hypothetical protein [Streptomyces sp. NPDC059513]